MSIQDLLRPSPPDLTVDITPRHVVAVACAGESAGGLRITGFAIEPLAEGAVTPALTTANIARPAEVSQAVRRAFERLGQRPHRCALVVPDGAAKVSLVRFQQVPARASDLSEMIRFHIRKAAPFSIEDSQISYSRGLASADGQEFVVVQARRDVVKEYETACESAGAVAGLVDLAGFNVANAVMAGADAPVGDWLLVHATATGAALAIYRGPHLVFFRHRGAEGEGHLGDLVHQTAMYYQDRLGGSGFDRVLVAGASLAEGASTVGSTVEARLGRAVERVDPLKAVTFADRVSLPPDQADLLTPAIGLALAQRAPQAGRG